MINKDNFKAQLRFLGFEEKGETFTKNFNTAGVYLKVDFKKEVLEYPESAGIIINERQTCNFSSAENAVVFECVNQLLLKGYKPKHIELEPKWKLGHGASGGRADILIKDQKEKPLLIIECKTYGKEFDKAWKDTLEDGGQLFSYAQQISETDFLCLYASEFDDKNIQINREQKIISHKDNKQILEQDEELKSFKKASNVKKRFEVWKETYQSEYTESGIFEENIQPYQIGKNNYTLDIDTRPVTVKDKDGKYHRFRTILRQHNIARKETAFEVLVNLFLAKIVDEEENKTNLEFYWKGIAYDNYYDFIDRLQKLYQIGMRKFLKDEVMYISNEQIDSAFWTVKNKRNATKKQIQKYFRDLKFFSNNAFSLINVHNERLFNRNTKVLVELVQMWQGLRLKTKEQNQFLGDMFEYFLDNSIKQSEGQFFTPIPITKFVVACLPLEEKIKTTSEPLKAIDYACGSGHFLNEYAHQIKPLVKKYKETEVSKYFDNIYGIEKEDRLAKVAKVSAYMYGQDQIKIIEEDALSDIEEIKPESFDVLVANPPFAVEGFLLNLHDKRKSEFDLINTTGLSSNSNNIQCFFLERAKQLMAPNGVTGIIVPTSILSNSDSTHIATREIILKYFDIISLVELGGGTFGKTGTNTVVLFLKRKAQKPEPALHYKNRVEDYFEGIKEDDKSTPEYQDLYLIKKYCEHTEIPFEEYQKLFGITPETISNLATLFKTEIFSTYKKNFVDSTEVKNLKKKKSFKEKKKDEQELELAKRLIKFLNTIEKDKLYYFMLAYENKQKVLIVKSPTNSKEQKQFLGYDWSGAKGSEGIQYNGGETVNDIITPMFNPQNFNDNNKINHLIKQNFLGEEPDNLSGFKNYKDLITYANTIDILDFSRKDFDKSFSLTPKKKITIETRWEVTKLENIAQITSGGTPSRQNNDYWTNGNIPWLRSEVCKEIVLEDNFEYEKISKSGFENSNTKWFNRETTLIALVGATKGKTAFLNFEATTNQNIAGIYSKDTSVVLNRFIYECLKVMYSLLIQDLSQYDMLNLAQIKNTKIPFPPLSVQQKFVSECEKIDNEIEKVKQDIKKANDSINALITKVFNDEYGKKKLSEIAVFKAGKFVSASDINDIQEEGMYPCYGGNGLRGYTTTFTHEGTYPLIGRQGALCGNVHKASGSFHATEHAVVVTPNEDIDVNWLYHILKFMNLNQYATGVAQPGLSVKNILPLLVPVPSISEQKKVVTKIEKFEKQIAVSENTIRSGTEKKQLIIEKHLK